MNTVIRIGTRESPLAVWQAKQVQNHLHESGLQSELVYIKSEGDTDTITPLYALGVQGIFTKALDAALLNNRVDIAVHSLKDVPVQLAEGIMQAAVLKRGSYKDVLVYKNKADLEALGFINNEWVHPSLLTTHNSSFTIATSSTRRIAQWLHRYPGHSIENLRGNVNTRLRKVETNSWNGAIFAAAGIERINLRPDNSVNLDWMLPAPAQGAIAVVCRKADETIYDACQNFNDNPTGLCVKIERDFLKVLMGGCSTPIGGLAVVNNDIVNFKGNILSINGKERVAIEKNANLAEASELGKIAGKEILEQGGKTIIEQIRHEFK